MAKDQTKGTSRSIYIDSQAAEFAMKRLQTEADKLRMKIDAGEASGKTMNKELAKLDQVNAKIKSVQQQLDAGLKPTLIQQQNLVRQLNNELSRMSSNDKGFKEKLENYRKAIQLLEEMRKKINGVSNDQDGMSKSGIFSGVFWANQLSKVIDKLREVASFAFKSALEAEGVSRAFDKLNRPELLDELRKATRGTVSDLELMKRAVAANNFQIPLENVGTLLEFASRRARDTGESVDYLVESIITGIARKSPLILDNLGINITRIQKEFAKTGDFAKAAFSVVNQELEKMGPALDTAADKIDRFKARFNNAMTDAATGLIIIANNIFDEFEKNISPATLMARKAMEQVAIDRENEKQRELSVINDYNEKFAKADKAGRDKIIQQVKAEIEITKNMNAVAILNGNKVLENSLDRRLELWNNFLANLQKGVPKTTETIAGIEGEISILTTQLKGLKIGSKEFIDTQNQINQLNKKLDAANGNNLKKQSDEIKRLRDQAISLIGALDTKIAEKTLNPLEFKYRQIEETLQKNIKTFLDASSALTKKELTEGIRKAQEDAILEINKAYDEETEKLRKKRGDAGIISINANKNKELIDFNRLIDDATKKTTFFDRVISIFQRNRQAGFQLNILRNPQGRERLDAELALLMEERRQKLAVVDLSENEVLLIEEEYLLKRGELIKNFYLEKINSVINLAQQAVGILDQLNQAATARENSELQQTLRNNDRRKKEIERLARTKVISEIEARKQIADIERDEQKKKDELEKKQLERGKKIALAQAYINGAMGITSVLAAKPGIADILTLSAFRAINIAFTVATTAAQVAAISGQKFERGGIANGGSHAQGGIKLYDTKSKKVVGEMEGGEPYMILSKNFRKNNPDFIAAALDSSMNRNGARIKPFWEARPYSRLDYSGLVNSQAIIRKFENGGVVSSIGSNSDSPSGSDITPKVLSMLEYNYQTLVSLSQSMEALNNTISNGIAASITLRQIDDAYDQRDRIIKEATG